MTRIASFATLLTFVTACLAASPVKRTVVHIESELYSIASVVYALDNELKAFPTSGASLASALNIHNGAVRLASDLAEAATDVFTTPASSITGAEADNILAIVQGFKPIILDALAQLVAKKPGFESLGVSPVVAIDLDTLTTNTKDLEDALIADTPTDLLSTAASITSAIDAALATASAAYA